MKFHRPEVNKFHRTELAVIRCSNELMSAAQYTDTDSYPERAVVVGRALLG